MGTAFLGVEASLTGRRWRGPSVAALRDAETLIQHHGLNDPLAMVLARRGVPPQDVPAFLTPKLKDLLPDPSVLKDMNTASTRIATALRGRERIAVFADYDVDGGSSAALLIDFARHFGVTPTLYVPDRIEEGYGPNPSAMAQLAADHTLIICVDCGTLSHDAFAAVHGADVIVLDHHLAGEALPPVLAVVNPNRQDEDGALSHLCAAGVVFLTLVAVARVLRSEGVQSPDLRRALDLVGLATVADVAPLIGVNRAFVMQGLKIMGQRTRPGLAALADVARLDTHPTSYHLGYVLGPRINAGGRIGQADLGARLLATQDRHEAEALAERLDALNHERREIEEAVRVAALDQALGRRGGEALTWAAGDGWHPGVVGIVAARLKEQTHQPSVVIGFDGDAGKGSGRSVPGIDLGAAIQRLHRDGLIEKGGGHKMAAGLSLTRAQLQPAMARLNDLLKAQGAGTFGPADLRLDGAVHPSALTVDLVRSLDAAGPFGTGAPGPRFALPTCKITFTKPVGNGHLKLSLSDGQTSVDAIAFSAFETPLGETLQNHDGARFHIAGRIEVNTWRGRQSVQVKVEDAAPVA